MASHVLLRRMNTKRIFTLLIALIMAVSLFLPGCNGSEESSAEPETTKKEFLVEIKTNGGMPLERIGFYVYNADDPNDLVWGGYTDKNGSLDFKANRANSLFAVLKDVPEGYIAEERYALTEGENTISLSAKLLDESAISDKVFESGSVAFDFSLKADGKEYKLSDLLSEKKAVVLNFWFINCGPCRSEFPFLQQAYEKYQNSVEIIAVNPYDGTESSVASYKEELGLSFPVIAGENDWINAFRINAFPTTVVIDRFGTVAMIHRGSFADFESVDRIFGYFTSEDYVQSKTNNLSDIKLS